MSSDGLTAAERRLAEVVGRHEQRYRKAANRLRLRRYAAMSTGVVLPLCAVGLSVIGGELCRPSDAHSHLVLTAIPFVLAVSFARDFDGLRGAWIAAGISLALMMRWGWASNMLARDLWYATCLAIAAGFPAQPGHSLRRVVARLTRRKVSAINRSTRSSEANG